MNVTATPSPKSSILLEIELPPERLSQAIDEAVRHLSRRTKIAGFRPGKAPRPIVERAVGYPAILDEALEHLVQRSYRDALAEQSIVPLTNAEVEIVEAEEGKPVRFTATVQVRPEVTLGDYRGFPFSPEIAETDDGKVDKVIDEMRDQQASLVAVEGRGAQAGDYAIIGFVGTRDGVPFDGGTSEKMPLILGENRLIPGFEDNLMGHGPGETVEFDITFPVDYQEASLAGQPVHFSVTIRELRAKAQPPADDEFARSMGPFADLATLRAEIRRRLERNALDGARHQFADQIIEYAVANATFELPDILIDQEVEVIHDELRGSLARQGIDEAAYLKAVNKTEADLHADFRPDAEKRVRALLVLSKVAEAEGIIVPDSDIEAEVNRARERYAENRRLVGYFESGRGRSFIRSSLRRSRVVEHLIDGWLAAHPEHPALPHAEEDEPAVDDRVAEANASIGATDPGAIADTTEEETAGSSSPAVASSPTASE